VPGLLLSDLLLSDLLLSDLLLSAPLLSDGGRCGKRLSMCGRFTQAVSWEELARQYGILDEAQPAGLAAADPVAAGDIYPGTDVALVRAGAAGREVARLHWGFRPAWKKDRTAPINARAETLFESGMWRESARKRRCVVPADGFYEPVGPKRPKRPQVYLTLPDRKALSIAALWTPWPGDDRDPACDTFALITTAANATVAPYHPRMPALLAGDAVDVWLDPGVTDRKLLASLLAPWHGAELAAQEISAGTAPGPTRDPTSDQASDQASDPPPREPDLFS
jgi:putative SOS response-associated peptidase YedK